MAKGWTPADLRRKGFVIDEQIGTAAAPPSIRLILPYPPSNWTLYAPVKSRLVLTQVARDYRSAAVHAARIQYRGYAPLQGRLKVTMEVHQPYERGLDEDNTKKAVYDALTHALVWKDDSQIDESHWKRVRYAETPHIVLTIEELPYEES